MRISHAAMPFVRLVVLLLFTGLCAAMFGYLWVNSGGRLPLISAKGYQVSINLPKVANLVYDADVMVAGVKSGKVSELEVESDHAKVTLRLEPSIVPLHEGATVQVRNKTMIEETFLEISDGTGKPLPDGVRLPDSAAKPAVQLNDVLAGIDSDTRKALASTIRSLGVGTKDSRDAISAALTGLGDLGRRGGDALGALAAQSEDLEALTGHTATLLSALDTRQGQLAQLVTDADRLTKATASGRGDIEATMRELPRLLDTAATASDGLNEVAGALGPVAGNLREAAPQLSAALTELPQTSADLRKLLPALDGVLDAAPQTLRRVPVVAKDAREIFPTLDVALADVNPMLAYLEPYGPDIAAFFTNVGQALSRGGPGGNALRVFMIFNEQSVRGQPFDANSLAPLNKRNPYPKPGQSADPGPFEGTYPRVERGER
ncbi:MAG: MlaD family protein [Haloechinothrix sp.]